MAIQTILEPLALDGDQGTINEAFDDTTPITIPEKQETFNKPKEVPKIWKWRLEGMTIVVLSVIVLSAALTVALLINIMVGDPQVKPHGAVAAENDYCASIGLEVMKKGGGNAVDAAVSTALCLTVVRPDVASLAGCGLMLIRDRNMQASHLFDFMCAAPAVASQPSPKKPETLVGIPGLIKGLHKAQVRFGKKNWNELFFGALRAIKSGFRPDPALLNAAKVKKQQDADSAGPIVDSLIATSSGTYLPPSALGVTYRDLARASPSELLCNSKNMSSLDRQLLGYIGKMGQNWTEDDLRNYTVNEQRAIEVEFAGFAVESFPAPVSGGPFLLSLLGNLDFMDTVRPLSSRALLKEDPEETALLLHRLIELFKFSKQATDGLGDITDPSLRDAALSAQKKMFSSTERQVIVQSVNDSSVLPWNVSDYSLLGSDFGDTGIVVTDSIRFTVVVNLFLGSPFGTGQVIPQTAVHLNAAMRLFDQPQDSSDESVKNTIAAGRRPLYPGAPVYVTTRHRKCGMRFGLASRGGIWGTFDAAQVITSAALFLRGATCHLPSSINPTVDTSPDQLIASKSIEIKSPVGRFTPAVTHGCLNMQLATNLPRMHPDVLTHSAENKTLALLVEALFERPLAEQLRRLGHDVRNESGLWPGRVMSAGWNGYDMITSLDNRGSCKLRSY